MGRVIYVMTTHWWCRVGLMISYIITRHMLVVGRVNGKLHNNETHAGSG